MATGSAEIPRTRLQLAEQRREVGQPGGDQVHDFALALTLGVTVGTYSSIFIAAPVLDYLGVRRETVVGTEKQVEQKTV